MAVSMSEPRSSVSLVIQAASAAISPYAFCLDSSLNITSMLTSAEAIADMKLMAAAILLSMSRPLRFALEAGEPDVMKYAITGSIMIATTDMSNLRTMPTPSSPNRITPTPTAIAIPMTAAMMVDMMTDA